MNVWLFVSQWRVKHSWYWSLSNAYGNTSIDSLNLHIEDINCNNIVCLAIVLKLSISSFLDTDVEKANKRKRFEPGTFKPIKANMAYIIIKINVFIGWITPKKVKILVWITPTSRICTCKVLYYAIHILNILIINQVSQVNFWLQMLFTSLNTNVCNKIKK